jgi:hypothetical protein
MERENGKNRAAGDEAKKSKKKTFVHVRFLDWGLRGEER